MRELGSVSEHIAVKPNHFIRFDKSYVVKENRYIIFL